MSLERILEHNFPVSELDAVWVYGSAAFPQTTGEDDEEKTAATHGKAAQSGDKQLDFIFVTRESVDKFHGANVARNCDHYNFLRLFPVRVISAINRFGPGLYFNAFCELDPLVAGGTETETDGEGNVQEEQDAGATGRSSERGGDADQDLGKHDEADRTNATPEEPDVKAEIRKRQEQIEKLSWRPRPDPKKIQREFVDYAESVIPTKCAGTQMNLGDQRSYVAAKLATQEGAVRAFRLANDTVGLCVSDGAALFEELGRAKRSPGAFLQSNEQSGGSTSSSSVPVSDPVSGSEHDKVSVGGQAPSSRAQVYCSLETGEQHTCARDEGAPVEDGGDSCVEDVDAVLGLGNFESGGASRESPASGAGSAKPLTVKYGVIERTTLLEDLRTWQHLYAAGRAHKPLVRLYFQGDKQRDRPWEFYKGVLESESAILENRVGAAQYARNKLLFDARGGTSGAKDVDWEKKKMFPEDMLWFHICALSYLGDVRNAFFEDPRKIERIIRGQRGLLEKVYHPLFPLARLEKMCGKELRALLEKDLFGKADSKVASEQIDKLLVGRFFRTRLAEKLGDLATFAMERVLTEGENRNATPDKILQLRVQKSSFLMACKGVVTNKWSNSLRYGFRKFMKRLRA